MKTLLAVGLVAALTGCFQDTAVSLLGKTQEQFGRGQFKQACSTAYDYVQLIKKDKQTSAKQLTDAMVLHANICTFGTK